MTYLETFLKGKCDFPYSFVYICTQRSMQVLMLHDVSVLVGLIFALVSVNSHDKLAVNNLFQVLMRSDRSVDKFHKFTNIFLLQNIRNNVWHNLAYSLEIFRFVFDDGSLQKLYQITLHYFGVINLFFSAIQISSKFV